MHESIAVNRDDETTPIDVEGDRDFALGCMERGIGALCVEQRAFGERRELLQERRSGNDCYDPMTQLALLGRTLPGERIYDVDRAIDYLASRDDVDMERLGLMGLSGGGMITICAAGLLPRVHLAMPAGHFCTYRDGLMSIHHCGCCYVPGIYNYAEMADVAGLFAPRPLVIVTGKDDRSKPLEGVRKAFRDLKRIYRAAGAEERCHLVVGDGGHRFYAEMAWPTMLEELARIG
jgi:dienelactone hydrolase